MTFKVGDDVIVELDGVDHPAEVRSVAKHSDYVRVRFHTDPSMDYGKPTPPVELPPEPPLIVHLKHVRPA